MYGIAVHVAAIESGHIYSSHHVGGQDPSPGKGQRYALRCCAEMGACGIETLMGDRFIHDVEELSLPHAGIESPYRCTSTSEPSAYPSRPDGTMTNPWASVTDERIEAPEMASGSTWDSRTVTRA